MQDGDDTRSNLPPPHTKLKQSAAPCSTTSVRTHPPAAVVEEGVSELFPSSFEIYFSRNPIMQDDDVTIAAIYHQHANSNSCIQTL